MFAEFGDGQLVYGFLWFFLFFIEIWLMISVFIDIFRSHDMKGWVKALWILFVLVIPLVGILVYFIARGDKMRAHSIDAAKEQQQAFQHYVQQAAGTNSPADQLAKLADLKEKGAITEEEYNRLKAEIINTPAGTASQ
ncbi:MAG TPA: SHOCT domain-containing protein [Acidimicrobiales bacterium]|jgi:type VI protein secretion system component VasK